MASQPSGRPSTFSQMGMSTRVRGRLRASTVTMVAYTVAPTMALNSASISAKDVIARLPSAGRKR
ncbi:hypothetical protein ACIHFD_62830 [Nonomuraea sp. NPDC051941]|uniref:hypothetical protein n=1 Tax=Nonomuraea sp. NPDC051941 TaxID=3364373 RepID=UPI0037C5B674